LALLRSHWESLQRSPKPPSNILRVQLIKKGGKSREKRVKRKRKRTGKKGRDEKGRGKEKKGEPPIHISGYVTVRAVCKIFYV